MSTIKLVDASFAALPYKSLTFTVKEYDDPFVSAASALEGIVIEVELLETLPV